MAVLSAANMRLLARVLNGSNTSLPTGVRLPGHALTAVLTSQRQSSSHARAVQPEPVNEPVRHHPMPHRAPHPHYSHMTYGFTSLTGRNKQNEDRVVCAQVAQHVHLFGIFDGHGGATVSQFLSDNVADAVSHELKSGHSLALALRNALATLDAALAKFREQYARVGATATVGLVTDSHITVASVGDSPAVLIRGHHPIQVNNIHRPDLGEERARIREAGGRIVWNPIPRVNGMLAVSRTIGYFDLRSSGVVPIPEIFEHRISAEHDHSLLLMTDGVSDVLPLTTVSDVVCSCSTPREASGTLVDFAYDQGSNDNISAIVVKLPAWKGARYSAVDAFAHRQRFVKPSS